MGNGLPFLRVPLGFYSRRDRHGIVLFFPLKPARHANLKSIQLAGYETPPICGSSSVIIGTDMSRDAVATKQFGRDSVGTRRRPLATTTRYLVRTPANRWPHIADSHRNWTPLVCADSSYALNSIIVISSRSLHRRRRRLCFRDDAVVSIGRRIVKHKQRMSQRVFDPVSNSAYLTMLLQRQKKMKTSWQRVGAAPNWARLDHWKLMSSLHSATRWRHYAPAAA